MEGEIEDSWLQYYKMCCK